MSEQEIVDEEKEIEVTGGEGNKGEAPKDLRLINWLASYPKSGNTWLRLFLSAYVFGNGRVDINKATGAFWDDRWGDSYDKISPRPMETLSLLESTCLRPAALFHMLHDFEYNECFVKTHNAYVHLGGIDLIPHDFTQQAFYIIRDPRQVVISFAHHGDREIDYNIDRLNNKYSVLEENKRFHCLGTWSKHVESWITIAPSKGIKVNIMRYEDMVENPGMVFESVAKALKVPFDRKILAQSIRATSLKNLQKQEKAKGFRERKGKSNFFRKGKLNEWRSVLTEEQINRIEREHGPLMQKLGYNLVTM